VCGIAGILNFFQSDDKRLVEEMANSFIHRGPDAGGEWVDADSGIAISHRRLSILDLSNQGAQPMVSTSGRYILSYNGEIYNFKELRQLLDQNFNPVWRGHSDTEILLASLEAQGIKETLKYINGMFAFALWDRNTRTLTLARDRMGEKPLYIGWIRKKIIFSSELKAFNILPDWQRDINEQAVGHLLRFGFVPGPLSIFNSIFKLPQAHYIQLEKKDIELVPSLNEFQKRCQCYWKINTIVSEGTKYHLPPNRKMAINTLDDILTETIAQKMVADVPVGALLSGGIDSSLVTAIMQKNSSRPVKTFTIGFEDTIYDEAKFSKQVSKHLGCDHTEVTLLPKKALDIIPQLPEIYSEPFADPSQIPTALVSSIARQNVTVALSGDGGDELFGGYARYFTSHNIWNILKWYPTFFRKRIGSWLINLNCKNHGLFETGKNRMLCFRLQRLGKRISVDNFEEYYGNMLALSHQRVITNNNCPILPSIIISPTFYPCGLDLEQKMMYIDQTSYLPDNILVKSDRASMASSLELRIPLLDKKIVEFSWKIPQQLRRDREGGKSLLRQLLYRYVPKDLVNRPKKGFDVPLDDWLRGPLREWMLDILSAKDLKENSFINEKIVSSLIEEHISGQANYGYSLWPIIMFQAWLKKTF